MIEVTDKISELEEEILKEIKNKTHVGNKTVRLLSERRLAELYSVPRAQVREAIKRLIRKNYLYNIPGSGTYINHQGCEPEAKEINISKPKKISDSKMLHISHIGALETQKLRVKCLPEEREWKELIKLFMAEYPFISVTTDCNDDEPFDLIINKTYELNIDHDKFAEVDLEQLSRLGFSADELIPGALDSCKVGGKLLGVPLLRTTSCLYANAEHMEKYGITADQIKSGYDIFKLGAMVEKQSGGDIIGSDYLGFIYHAALEGLTLYRERDSIGFDTDKFKAFINGIKPYIRKHHLSRKPTLHLSDFMAGKSLFCPNFWSIYPDMKSNNPKTTTINLPLEKDGFLCEWMHLGAIPKESKHTEEANLLLAFLSGKKAQSLLTDDTPCWLAVRNEVIEEQKKRLSLPEKTLDFDARSYYPQLDPMIWWTGPQINTILAKHFTGLMDLNDAIEQIKRCNQ